MTLDDGVQIQLYINNTLTINFYDDSPLVLYDSGYLAFYNTSKLIIMNSSAKSDIAPSFAGMSIIGDAVFDDNNLKICPFVSSQALFVPLRHIAEALGGEASWDTLSEKVKVIYGRKTFYLSDDSNIMVCGDEHIELDKTPILTYGRINVTLDTLRKIFGLPVYYNESGLAVIGADHLSSESILQDVISAIKYGYSK